MQGSAADLGIVGVGIGAPYGACLCICSGTRTTDRATAALLTDLKNRGMLDDTLVLWGGEFGRTPMAQGSGRDHHINAFSVWMAGGGVKGGMSYGATDELGYRSVENVVHVRDLHATLLHLFGVDHERLAVHPSGARTPRLRLQRFPALR